jgi:lysophospholipase L1-like esterase
VNVGIVVGLLALAECGARLVQARRLGPNAYAPSHFMDRWTGWRNAPDYDRIDIHHDHQGFRRDGDVSLEKPPNTVRIFFLGGSAAYGSEGLFRALDPDWRRIYNRDLIDVWLEKRLQREHPEKHWEVINAAVNEFRMHQSLILIYEKLLLYKPDLIIFFDGHNDMSGIMGPTGPVYDAFASTPHEAEFQALTYPKTLSSLVFSMGTWLRNNSVLFAGIQRHIQERHQFGPPPDSGAVPTPVALDDLTAELRQRAELNLSSHAGYYVQMAERIANALDHEKIPVVFALQPELILSPKPLTPVETKFAAHMRELSGRYGTYMYEQLRPRIAQDMADSARRNGFTFVDTADAFSGVREKTFTDYCHLTSRGNELMADKLYEAISDTLIPRLIASNAVFGRHPDINSTSSKSAPKQTRHSGPTRVTAALTGAPIGEAAALVSLAPLSK